MKLAIGVDIGGTKISVTLGTIHEDGIEFLFSERYETQGPWVMVLGRAAAAAKKMLAGRGKDEVSIGISCGGPLDSKTGRILSPPNLPGWDNVPVTQFFQDRLGFPARLQNDADACALAEWKYGAGKGFKNIVFLTFGTGFGAGLILNGGLYSGTHDGAGEIGHVRMEQHGPVGYGKSGSLEGFCSGGGIVQIGERVARERIQAGRPPKYCATLGDLGKLTAKNIGDAAEAGDEAACEVYRLSGEILGRGLAILVDLLNPERIIIGSIFARSRALIWPYAEKILEAEALPRSYEACLVVPSALGDSLGDYAAVSIAP